MMQHKGKLRDAIRVRWKNVQQQETYRDFLAVCDAKGRHRAFVLEDLMRDYVRRHAARKGA